MPHSQTSITSHMSPPPQKKIHCCITFPEDGSVRWCVDYRALNKVTVKDTYLLPLIGVYNQIWPFLVPPHGFGVYNAPETFERAINLVFDRLHWKIYLAFLVDVLIIGTTAEKHLDNLRQVFERSRQYCLKFKSKKCEYFGRRLSSSVAQ